MAVVLAAVGLGIDSAMTRKLSWLAGFFIARCGILHLPHCLSHVAMTMQTQSCTQLLTWLHKSQSLPPLASNSLSGVGPLSIGKSFLLSDDGAFAADMICVGVRLAVVQSSLSSGTF